ncbi:MAG TPA: sigma-70 family RNA polymerase sigma factor [Polyangiaceae bacterium]|nr:sigma-70 family RNA polymerase sigma factor [Polyangiaceae bacterium]
MFALKQDKNHEPLEFSDVFAHYSPFAWRVLARLGVERRDVPDACQEVFLVVHRRLPEFDASRANLRSWLYGICVRTASDYRRRHPSRRETNDDALHSLGVPATQEHSVDEARAWKRLARVLDRLDSAQRSAFVLYELEAISMNEVAAILECPLQTAYSRLHAARRAVFEAFAVQEAR